MYNATSSVAERTTAVTGLAIRSVRVLCSILSNHYYGATGALPGDPARLPGLIDRFFQSVLERLRNNPDSFFGVIDELTELFHEHRVKVRISEAFRNLEDWNDLLDALDELSRYPAPETFDLFCSALFAYDELVEPDDG